MKNTLVVIGYLSMMRCYLNVTKKDAIERYLRTHELDELLQHDYDNIEIIEFDDEFCAYDVWACRN